MPVTNAEIDSAVPSAGTPVRSLTNAALKGLISDIAAVGVGVGVGTVNTFADLPTASTVAGQRWWVLTSTGVWLVNRRTKGAYYSDGASWSFLGDFPVTAVEVGFTPSGTIAAADVQGAIQELDDETQTSLGLKANLAGPTFTGTVGGVTKSMVGLSNVDDTADSSKPLFTSGVRGLTPASGGGTTNFLRADGTFAAPPGSGSTDPLDLAVTNPAAPAVDTVRLFRRDVAGRQMPAFIGPSGLDSVLQPFLARNKVGVWMPPGNSTTAPAVFGYTPLTFSGATGTARNVATTNIFTRMRRLGYICTTSTPSSSLVARIAVFQYTLGITIGGVAVGGFTKILRFGVSDTMASGCRMFAGMISANPSTTADPSTYTNIIGLGCGVADTNLSIYYGGSAAQTPIALGANFPANTNSVDVYELALFCPPGDVGDKIVNYQVTRLNTGDVATGTLTATTAGVELPLNTTLLSNHWIHRQNGANTVAPAFDIFSDYIETDQ